MGEVSLRLPASGDLVALVPALVTSALAGYDLPEHRLGHLRLAVLDACRAARGTASGTLDVRVRVGAGEVRPGEIRVVVTGSGAHGRDLLSTGALVDRLEVSTRASTCRIELVLAVDG